MELLPTYTDFLITESLKYYNGVLQEDVEDTVNNIKTVLLPLLRLSEDDVSFIGSAGKLKTGSESHNINMAIDVNSIVKENSLDHKSDIPTFLQSQLKRLKYDYKLIKEKNRVIIEWPIKGSEDNGCVELHLQMSENLKWVNFARFAPNLNETESSYTGKHREFFLESIVASMDKKIINYYKEDVVKEYEKYELIFDEGLTKVRKSFEGKNGYLKKPRVLEDSRRLITNDPDRFAELVFGEEYDAEDIMTFEQCYELFNSEDFPLRKKRDKIKKIFKNKLSGYALIVPEGIM